MTIKKPYKIILNILFVALYSFVCCEILIRGISYVTNVYDIEMLKYAVKLKHISSNPNLNHEHIPNSSASLMGVDISLNSLGHRTGELPENKPNGEKRIHVIGSSFTLGWGVENKNTFSTQLEMKLNQQKPNDFNFRVINAGIGNTNARLYTELFNLQVDKTDPDIVIMQYFINDAEVISKKTNNPIYRHLMSVLYISQTIQTAWYSFLNSGTLTNYYEQLYTEESRGWKNVISSVTALKTICDDRNIELIICLIPDLHNFNENDDITKLYTKILSVFNSLGITTINTFTSLSQEFRDSPKEAWVSHDDAHPNAKVHSIIATDLFTLLRGYLNSEFNE